MKLNSKSQRLHVDETYDADQTLTVRENDETEKSKSQNTLIDKNHHRKISHVLDSQINDYDIDEEEQILVQNLLQFELPTNLLDDKLLYRKLFRLTRLSNEEYRRKMRNKPIVSAFEIYSNIPPENTGPKVLYITAKSQDGKDRDSDVLKDIEGHPIEKI